MNTRTRDAAAVLVARAPDDADDEAWSELVHRYNALVLWTARRAGLSAEDAADAAQLTWVRCWQHLGQLNRTESLGSWLVTICRREAIRVASQRLRDLLVDDVEQLTLRSAASAEPPATSTGHIDDQLELAWHAEVLRSAVASLPTRQRRLIEVLLEPEPGPYSQIGRRLGMPVGSIGPIRQRACTGSRASCGPGE
jgi:RNA polymerase sigma factor (sigma-70 family)